MLLYVLGTILCFTAPAGAYPGAGGEAKTNCLKCHSNSTFNNQVVFQLINSTTKENVVRGDTAYIPIKQGDSESYTLILGSNGKSSVKAKIISWMFVLPGGVKTELPNSIRLLNSKQEFRYKKRNKEGHVIEENDNLTVATQTFFFDGNVGNYSKGLQGEIRVAMGLAGAGNSGLGESFLKLIFVY